MPNKNMSDDPSLTELPSIERPAAAKAKGKRKATNPLPERLPDYQPTPITFCSLKINITTDIDVQIPSEIFEFFFESVWAILRDNTNEYARLHGESDHRRPRPWVPCSVQEIQAFVGIIIYMGLHREHDADSYWVVRPDETSLHPQVRCALGQTRFEQIDRFFHISTPQLDEDEYETAWEKVEPLSHMLQALFLHAVSPGTHLAVDEAITRCTGRSWDIVTIPTKPTPTGYKMWVAAAEGYVLDFLYHTKKNKLGPVSLDPEFKKQLSNTEAVVPTLLKRIQPSGNNAHIVWLDNLFTSQKLCKVLQNEGWGVAGTVQKSSTRGYDTDLLDFRVNSSNAIPWGTQYAKIVDGVVHIAWKDNANVGMMSTVSRPQETRIKSRKVRSNTRRQNPAPFARQNEAIPVSFDDYNHYMNAVDIADHRRQSYGLQRIHNKPWKAIWYWLLETTVCNAAFIWARANFVRGSTNFKESHYNYRSQLATYLMSQTPQQSQGHHPHQALPDLQEVVTPQNQHNPIRGRNKFCEVCKREGKMAQDTSKRVVLGELSLNSLSTQGVRRQRTVRTRNWCEQCSIAVCKAKHCWERHKDVAITLSKEIKSQQHAEVEQSMEDTVLP